MAADKSGDKRRKQAEEVREHGLTYDDYAALEDDNRYELVNGSLELMSAPTTVHQLIGAELFHAIYDTCRTDYILLMAPVDVILSTYEVRQPDLVMVRRDRMNIISKRGIEGAPDVVAEILSPSTLRRDRLDKGKVYAKYGIPEYWVIAPETGSLEQFLLEGGRYELHNVYAGADAVQSPNLPCASFTMKEIMERIPDIRDA